MVVFYKIWKKYNEIHLTKNKMDLNRNMKNHPPSHVPYTTPISVIADEVTYIYSRIYGRGSCSIR